jgi:hypothetical protein
MSHSVEIHSSIGAVADMFDMACLVHESDFSTIQDPVYAKWNAAPPNATPQQVVDSIGPFRLLGHHYFITNPITGTGLSPKWDFTEALHNSNAFVVGNKTGDLPAPTGSADVDWLMLNAVEGKLAKQVFRIYTKGGSAPTSVSLLKTRSLLSRIQLLCFQPVHAGI